MGFGKNMDIPSLFVIRGLFDVFYKICKLNV